MAQVPHRCITCSQTFPVLALLAQHCAEFPGHIPHPYCCLSCDKSFHDIDGLQMHMSLEHRGSSVVSMTTSLPTVKPTPPSSLGGKDILEIPAKPSKQTAHRTVIHHCPQCKRKFKTANDLNQHKKSVVHVKRKISCPVSKCACKFKTVSGVAHHVECGRAHPEISRQDVTRAIQQMDTNGTISIHRQITGPVGAAKSTVTKFLATEASFNGKSYTCPLCKKKLKTLAGLQGHLNSPSRTHDANEFKCPRCTKKFKLISALTQHFEAKGCMETKNVERYLKRLTNHVPQPRVGL